jgi:hypothetical protein
VADLYDPGIAMSVEVGDPSCPVGADPAAVEAMRIALRTGAEVLFRSADAPTASAV